MIIMKIVGGFASQLNKFLFGSLLAAGYGTQYGIDLSDYAEGYFRRCCLDYLKLPEVRRFYSGKELKKVPRLSRISGSRGLEAMRPHSRKNYYIYCEEKDCTEFLRRNPALRVGADNPLLRGLALRKPSAMVERFRERLRGRPGIALHVRRGDFAALGWADDVRFFKGALCRLFVEWPAAEFYFFSNDIAWCEEAFGQNGRFHYVAGMGGDVGDIEELLCMSYCSLRILSKFSSFGILANMLAASLCPGGYAIMDGSALLEEEIEMKKDDALMRSYLEQAHAAPAEGTGSPERGGIRYLTAQEYLAWAEKYDSLVMGREGSGGFAACRGELEGDAQKLCLDVQKLGKDHYARLLCREYRRSLQAGEEEKAVQLLERLQASGYPGIDCRAEWRRHYGVSGGQRYTAYLFSYKAQDRWKINGLYKLGCMLARIGWKVYYIDMRLMKETGEGQEELFYIPEGDMDGREWGMYGLDRERGASRRQLEAQVRGRKEPCCLITDWKLPVSGEGCACFRIRGMLGKKELLQYLTDRLAGGERRLAGGRAGRLQKSSITIQYKDGLTQHGTQDAEDMADIMRRVESGYTDALLRIVEEAGKRAGDGDENGGRITYTEKEGKR